MEQIKPVTRCECSHFHGKGAYGGMRHCQTDAVRMVTVRPYLPQPGEPIVIFDFGAPQHGIAGHRDFSDLDLGVKVRWPTGREDYIDPDHIGLLVPMCEACAAYHESEVSK